jgi:hypothetical protein
MQSITSCLSYVQNQLLHNDCLLSDIFHNGGGSFDGTTRNIIMMLRVLSSGSTLSIVLCL